MKNFNQKALILAAILISSTAAQAGVMDNIKGAWNSAKTWTVTQWGNAKSTISSDLSQTGVGAKISNLAQNKYFWIGTGAAVAATYGSYRLIKRLTAPKARITTSVQVTRK